MRDAVALVADLAVAAVAVGALIPQALRERLSAQDFVRAETGALVGGRLLLARLLADPRRGLGEVGALGGDLEPARRLAAGAADVPAEIDSAAKHAAGDQRPSGTHHHLPARQATVGERAG